MFRPYSVDIPADAHASPAAPLHRAHHGIRPRAALTAEYAARLPTGAFIIASPRNTCLLGE